jgi:hypothetical protein
MLSTRPICRASLGRAKAGDQISTFDILSLVKPAPLINGSSSAPERPGFFETGDRSEAGPIPNVSASLELAEERRLVAYGFVTAVGGTGTFNFWQNAAKRGSFL